MCFHNDSPSEPFTLKGPTFRLDFFSVSDRTDPLMILLTFFLGGKFARVCLSGETPKWRGLRARARRDACWGGGRSGHGSPASRHTEHPRQQKGNALRVNTRCIWRASAPPFAVESWLLSSLTPLAATTRSPTNATSRWQRHLATDVITILNLRIVA